MPLTGIRVLDLTRVLSGPFCTMALGDMGAEIIKVETPGEGDLVRRQGVIKDGLSWYFASFNRNKRSVAINLRTPEGKEILEKLIAVSDVVVDNYRPGVLDRMGFSRQRLAELRPGIIACSITGFGDTGPYRDRPAFDFIAQAMSGFMSVNGRADDPPLRSGLPISDLVAGMYAAMGILAALVKRERTGQGEVVSTSLTTGLVSLLSYVASTYFATGQILPRTGNDHPIAAPYGLFQARDGQVAIAPSDDSFFGKLVDALGIGHLKSDPEFATNQQRVRNRAHLNAQVEERVATETCDHWVRVLNEAGVPCSPVYSVAQVFADPQMQHEEMAIDVPHPRHGNVRMLGFPVKFEGSPCRIRHPAPDLGEHTAEVLRSIGYGDAEIAALSGKKVI